MTSGSLATVLSRGGEFEDSINGDAFAAAAITLPTPASSWRWALRAHRCVSCRALCFPCGIAVVAVVGMDVGSAGGCEGGSVADSGQIGCT